MISLQAQLAPDAPAVWGSSRDTDALEFRARAAERPCLTELGNPDRHVNLSRARLDKPLC
jgi:hypothetical protein